MLSLSFPAVPPVPMREQNGQAQLLCAIRRRWVRITEEEWVRQNLVHVLASDFHFPTSNMAVEKSLLLGGRRKRFDLLIYANATPWMMVECKEPQVALTGAVLQQALEYNSLMEADFLLLSNGVHHLLWQLKPQVLALATLPPYPSRG